ncbi:MAG: class I SAM-dependent methyltransferase, partial [Anaerolineales bacterium]|nr:class I SAM-dependent methyltransferase [Anaerolineales bacterium]
NPGVAGPGIVVFGAQGPPAAVGEPGSCRSDPMSEVDKSKLESYGRSEHYLGEAGERYFAGQKTGGQLSVQWNLPFWLPHLKPAGSVLDFGCGGGYLLAGLPVGSKTGVEINPAARQEVQRQGIDVYPSLEDIPGGRAFDCILSSHALEHVPSPLLALKAMRPLLRPDGKLLLLLPLDDWRARHHHRYHPNDIHFHLYAWTPQNLGNLLVEAGFVPQEVRVITDAMPPLPIARRMLPFPWLRKATGWLAGAALNRRQLWASAVKQEA